MGLRRFFCAVSSVCLGLALTVAGEPIHDAIRGRDVAAVKRLIQQDPGVLAIPSGDGLLPLHLAAYGDAANVAAALLDAGANAAAKDSRGETALHVAAARNATNCVVLFLSRGLDPKARTPAGKMPHELALDTGAEAAYRLLLAGTTAGYEDRSIDARFRDGTRAYRDGDMARAYEVLTRLVLEDPANPKYNFALGLTCVSMKDHTRAQMAFERVLQAEPDNLRAQAELGRTYLLTRQYVLAERRFRDLLEKRDLSPEVRKNVERYWQAARAGTQGYSVLGRLDIGWFRDSNINIGPDSDEIRIAPLVFGSQVMTSLAVSDASQPFEADGLFTTLSLSGLMEAGEPGSWAMVWDAMAYANWIDDRPDSESLYAVCGAGMRYSGVRHIAQLPVRFSHVSIGHNPLVAQYAVSPSVTMTADGGRMLFTTAGQMELRNYDAVDSRDSLYTAVGETVRCVLSKAGHSAILGVTMFRDRTDAAAYEQTGMNWTLGFDLRLPRRIRFYAMARRQMADYAEREPLMLEDRSDTQNQVTLGLSRMFMPRWGADVNHQMTRNASTFGLYQYDRDVTTVSTYVTF